MASRQAQVTIFSEDQQHEVFVRRFLLAIGFDRTKIQLKTSPKARGSAEQFVREQYADQLQGHRRRSARMSVRLVVVIDADILTLKNVEMTSIRPSRRRTSRIFPTTREWPS